MVWSWNKDEEEEEVDELVEGGDGGREEGESIGGRGGEGISRIEDGGISAVEIVSLDWIISTVSLQ